MRQAAGPLSAPAARLVAALALVSLGGCGGADLADLREFTRTAFQDAAPQIDPLPQLEPYETFLYAGEGLTDPFLALNLREVAVVAERDESDVYQPERRREALEQFPLDSLNMLGTMTGEDASWVLIGAPDGGTHTVTIGNHLGRQNGKIVRINEQEVTIREVVRGPSGQWEERSASLSLGQ